jgi:protein phosphatase methylesterase 1
MSDLRKKLLKDQPQFRGLPPRTPPVASAASANSRRADIRSSKRDYSLIPWTKYFDASREVRLDNGSRFRVYVKGDSGPVFFFLHGGGFSGLSWSLLSSQLEAKIRCQCYALDIRGHGDTETNDDEDLSIDTMSK